MLCLPNNPEINNTTTTVGSSYIYGMEYEQNVFKPDANNEDVPCALCRSRDSHSSVMIPGRMMCYPGWKREYYGYLSSGATGHTSSDYICVDINPEYTPGGQADKDTHLCLINCMWIYAMSTLQTCNTTLLCCLLKINQCTTCNQDFAILTTNQRYNF